MKKKLVFILSSNYSGSHFFSLMLGSHSKATHLGELKNIHKGSSARSCYICGEYCKCELFRGVSQEAKSNLYEILFSRVDNSVQFLVDASKKPKWFRDFVDDDRYDIKLIHLIRDPRALARRWLIRIPELGTERRERINQCRKSPFRAPLFLFGDLLSVCMYKWYAQNREITRFIEKSGLPAKVVTYRNLAKEPDETLADVCEFIGVDYEPGQKNYWDFEHHGTQKSEYEWVGKQGGASYFDLRWKEFLDIGQQQRITNNKTIQRFLKSLGLAFVDDGLQHINR